MNRKKILRFGTYTKALLLSSMIAMVGCEQEIPLEDQDTNLSGMSEAVKNPYSVSVMQAALDELSENTAFNTAGIDVIENHQYIQFKMPLEVPAEELELQIDLYDYPVLSSPDAGEGIGSSKPSAYYAIIPVGATPPGDYTVLSSLYLPTVLETAEREQDLVLLERKAYELAGWLADERSEENGRWIDFDLKWRPGGRIQAKNGSGSKIPLKGIKVNMARAGQSWAMSGKTSYTDNDGKFRWNGDRPIGLVRYRFRPDKYEGNRMIFSRQKIRTVLFLDGGTVYYVLDDPPYKHEKRATRDQFNITLDGTPATYYLSHLAHEEYVKENQLPFKENKPPMLIKEYKEFEGWNHAKILAREGKHYFIHKPKVDWHSLSYIFMWHEVDHSFPLGLDMQQGIAMALHLLRYRNADPSAYVDGNHHLHITRVFLDLIDDDEDPHPAGYGKPRDKVSGYTVNELLQSLEGVSSFTSWAIELLEEADGPEEMEKLNNLFFPIVN